MNQRNHPELVWKSLRTEHFEIHYHDPLLPWARDAASILERVHDPLCRRLDVVPRGRTRVYLSDQDQIANGAAIAWDYFFVWIPSHAVHQAFAGGRWWFEEVLVHEYTHVLISEASRTWLGTLAFPLGAYPPRWLHEGIAQWTAEAWSVLRGDQILAAALLDGSMESSPPGVPGRERLIYYARGHARVRWLAEAYGDTTIPKLLRAIGPWGTYSYGAAERAALGKSSADASDRFRRDMIAFYGRRFAEGESPESLGSPLDLGVLYPRRVVMGSGGDSASWIVGQIRRGPVESSLLRSRSRRGPERIVTGGVVEGPLVLDERRALVTRYHRAAHGSWVTDLSLWEKGRGPRFLSSGARLVEVAAIGAGGRLAALSDSSGGPALLTSGLPGRGEPWAWRTRTRWPRGWIVHSLAVSPDGSRASVSASDPSGGQALWGIEMEVDSPPLALTRDGAPTRGTAWLDDERLAWTSYAGGIAHARTARWPRGAATVTEEAARTATGVGTEVAGVRGDSLLILDKTSRRKTGVVRIDPDRIPARGLPAPAYPFPVEPAVGPEEMGEIAIQGPSPYRAWKEVRPWLRLPLAGMQAGEPALGFAGLWAEPLLRHAAGGFLYASAEQMNHPDRSLFYLTSRFGPWVVLYHGSMLVTRRLLEHHDLTERVEMTGAAFLAPLHAESDPQVGAWLEGFARTESRRPRFGGRERRTPLGAPSSWSTLSLGLGGGWIRVPSHAASAVGAREGFGTTFRLHGGLDAWPASERFLRGSAQAFLARPLPMRSTLWVESAVRATSLPVPPQEYEGLDTDASHRLGDGLVIYSGTVFLRGWPEARMARWVLYGNLELRLPVLPDLGFRGPGFRIGAGTLAPFAEVAHPWGGASAGLFEERSRSAYGFEARLSARVGPFSLVPAAAWGHPFGSRGPRGSWSVRVAGALPFPVPLSPGAVLGALFPGALQDGGMPRSLVEPPDTP